MKKIENLLGQASRIFQGKDEKIEAALCCMLGKGHLLIEDLPGVGKTTFAYLMAKLLNLKLKRIQFTNDLLPGDVIGTNIFSKKEEKFLFVKGPIFTEFLLADELNRATPKSQSALLQAMEEKVISIDGNDYKLDSAFFVMATQNPYQLIGTYQLPESQIDRFMAGISFGLPEREIEKNIIKEGSARDRIDELSPILNKDEFLDLQEIVKKMFVKDDVIDYALDLIEYCRNNTESGQVLTVRTSQDLMAMAKANAFIKSRDYVIPEDIKRAFLWVIPHRIGGQRGIGYGLDLAQEISQKVSSPF